jgi:hypothetical protein
MGKGVRWDDMRVEMKRGVKVCKENRLECNFGLK